MAIRGDVARSLAYVCVVLVKKVSQPFGQLLRYIYVTDPDVGHCLT